MVFSARFERISNAASNLEIATRHACMRRPPRARAGDGDGCG
jgi:hypothetical protein